MADGANFDSTEVKLLAEALVSGAGGVGAKAAKVLRSSALAVERDAKAVVPVDTGFLKGSITTDIEADGRFMSMSAEIGPTANYGGYVEYGTSRMSPQPYMGPALDKNKDKFERGIAEIGEDSVA
jgi:HK97 gp10 family phage protein